MGHTIQFIIKDNSNEYMNNSIPIFYCLNLFLLTRPTSNDLRITNFQQVQKISHSYEVVFFYTDIFYEASGYIILKKRTYMTKINCSTKPQMQKIILHFSQY